MITLKNTRADVSAERFATKSRAHPSGQHTVIVDLVRGLLELHSPAGQRLRKKTSR